MKNLNQFAKPMEIEAFVIIIKPNFSYIYTYLNNTPCLKIKVTA